VEKERLTAPVAGSGAPSGPLGRDAEQATISAFLEAIARGPAALVITGPAGIGKTTIWQELQTRALRLGFRTMETRAVEAEAQLAFAGLADLLDPVIDEVLDGLPPAQRVGLEVALQRVPIEGSPPPPLAVSLGALASIRALAERAPVILAVDDLPWLDGPSARVLEYTVRRLAGSRVGLVAAIRATTPDVALPPIASAFAGRIERLHLGPLDLNAIDALVRRELGLSLRRPALSWIHEQSGGNPFLALEIARTVQRTGRSPWLEGLALPTATDELIRARLDALPASVRWPLAAVAALGRPSVALVAALDPGATDALEAARLAGIVEVDGDRVHFTHPLLAAGAFGLLDPAAQRRLHARLAEAATDPEQRARHLALSVDSPTEAVASELERASIDAQSRGASDAAAELALQAARSTPHEDQEAIRRRVMAAGSSSIQAGDPTRARSIMEDYCATAPHGPGRADALRVLADARSSDDWQARERILEEALQEAGTDPRLRSQILESLAQTKWQLVRDAPGYLALALAALSEAEAQDDPATRCSAYLTAYLAHVNTDDVLANELLDRAFELGPQVEHLRVFQWPAFCEAMTDQMCGRIERSIATFSHLLKRAAETGDWDSAPLFSMNLAYARFRSGAWQEARADAIDAERAARLNGQPLSLSFALTSRAVIETAFGDEPAARLAVEESLHLAQAVGSRNAELGCHGALGFLALSMGDIPTAVAELRSAVHGWLDEGYGHLIGSWLPELTEALAAADRVSEAIQLLDAHETAARSLGSLSELAANRRVRGLVATVRGDEAGAMEAYAEALAPRTGGDHPFERARTLLARGETLRRFRRRGQARDALEEAVRIFDSLGARRWLERATAELARTGHREAGSLLTATELQVAGLVAAGRTNREVAEVLFMSPHTVEAHLTRIYRSLGVRSRTEMVRVLAARAVDGQEPGATSNEGRG
jgi:DNA-binding CsgD family transcriptional regulator